MGKSFAFRVVGLIENLGGTTTMKAYTTTTIDDADDTDFDARAVVSTGTSTDALAIELSDSTSGSDVVRWVCHLRTTELTFT